MSLRPPNAMKSLRFAKIPTLLQRDLALRVGCTQSDLSAYETGRVLPDLPRAMEIASALGVTVEAVFFGEVEAALVRNATRLRTLQQAISPTSLPDPATPTR